MFPTTLTCSCASSPLQAPKPAGAPAAAAPPSAAAPAAPAAPPRKYGGLSDADRI
jgi:NADH dehydrogenase (ubiquinone) flavoprotein 1